MKHVAGFTLVELLAVLVVLGMVSLMAWPVFNRTLANHQLRQTAEQMAWELRAQQQEAIAFGSSRQIEFSLYGNYYNVLKPELRRVYLPEKIRFHYITIPKTGGNRYLLDFDILGRPNLGGTIALKNEFGSEQYVIITPVIGRIRISDKPPE
ncbi:MAG: prepilin-type N-terminal cleavage/methylation domain-containing protein [Bacillota bacterium]